MESDSPTSGPPTETSRFAVLLFTDIVDSTKANDDHGVEAYSEALSTHNRLFERLIRERRGVRMLRNTGDGFFVEVASVVEAVKLALLFQDALRDGPWSEVRLTSRVGIHAGEIRVLDGGDGSEIVAPAVNIASRVMNLAVGGQILLTRFPFDNARPFMREPPMVAGKSMPPLRWEAHGAYRLKGIGDPVEIFEVGCAGIAPFVLPPDSEKAQRIAEAGEKKPGASGAVRTGEGPVGRGMALGTSSQPVLARRIRRDFLLGLLALSIAYTFQLGLERTPRGIVLKRWISSQLQLTLGSADVSRTKEILIVDISGIPQEPVVDDSLPAGTEASVATPRGKLVEIVAAIAEMKPRTIAIDLDFSVWQNGRPVTPRDAEFFAQMLALADKHQVPIYLGVSRQRWKGAAQWLGAERFHRLAAGIEAPEETCFYVRWLRGLESKEALPNFALALAGRAEEAGQEEQPSAWQWAVQSAQMRSAVPPRPGAPSPGVMSWAWVDYSFLQALENQSLGVVRVGTILDNKTKFRDRMVLLGDASEPQHYDQFTVDGKRRPVPGVYLHACAALTAVGRPLLDLTPAGRSVGFMGVALGIMGGISSIRWANARRRPANGRQNPWRYPSLIGTAILLSWFAAVFLVNFTRVLWTDFIAVTIGLCLHLYLRARADRRQREQSDQLKTRDESPAF